MEYSDEHNTDGSSIKPVSSLRSHFEKLQGSRTNHTVLHTISSKQFSHHLRHDTDKSIEHDWEDRRSLDIARNIVYQSTDIGPSNLQNPTTIKSRLKNPDFSTSSRPRPQSMGPLSPPVSPPAVTVNSPTSTAALPYDYEEERIYASSTQSSTAPAGLITPSQEHDSHLAHAIKVPFEKLAASPSKIKSHLHIKSMQNSNAPSGPPPVNRAAKPKMFSKTAENNSIVHHNHLTIELKGGARSDKVSPFSTPPSSDNEETPDESPTIARHGVWQEPYKETRDIHPRRVRHQDSKTEHAEVQPDRKVPTPPTSRKPSKQTTISSSDIPTHRPILPPRKEIDTHHASNDRSTRPQAIRRNTSNTSETQSSEERSIGHHPSVKKAIPSRFHASMDNHWHRHNDEDLHSDPSPRNPSPQQHRSSTSQDESDGNSDQTIEPQEAFPTDFPNATHVNRRSPRFRDRPWEINTGYDTKVFAVSGEYVCSTGFITRVWNLLTGQLILDLPHQDTTKVTAIAFRPSSNGSYEGKVLWLGTNSGEILEVDINSGEIVNSNGHAHNRREILKIYRYGSSMWTLDDDGKLNIWRPDTHGDIDLPCTPYALRIPKGHTYSLVKGGKLWIATGKEIRVFQPEKEDRGEFHVLDRPLCQPHLGGITSGAVIPNQSDRIYFGHVDGKISIYSCKDYTCIDVVNISLYRINSLVGVGNYLWAGYYTGMIYVYDTTQQPWKVLKDWKAHRNHRIAGLIVDRSSIWKMNRLQVASLGTDNLIQLWDGMLRQDWLESTLHQRIPKFCSFNEVSILVLSWNAGAAKPSHIEHDNHDKNFFEEFLQSNDAPDIIVFGFQELVDLEGKKTTALSLFKSKKKVSSDHDHMRHQYRVWVEHLSRYVDVYLPASNAYTLLHTGSLVGLFTCIFVKGSLKNRITNFSTAVVKCGMGGLHGNKGALIARFTIDDTSVCLANCHLAAGQKHTVQRNNDIATILEAEALPACPDTTKQTNWCIDGGDGTMIMDHEVCILNGDLNYRIDVMGRDSVIRTIRERNLARLLERDQLLISRRRNPGFRLRAFCEAPITFAPTYKYDVGSDQYDSSDKKRSPAWCDRILYRSPYIKQLSYQRQELRASDHRPVSALFKFKAKTISEKKQEAVWKECEEGFESTKKRVATETNLDYLIEVYGLSLREAEKLLKK